MSPEKTWADPVRHEVVLASAGAGKTYQLSLRIVKLLTLGAKPEEIVALTFTRAAAQEFAARTLGMLAGAAASDKGAAELSAEMKLSEPRSREFYADLLRDTLHNLQRLTLGTLDSFFARLVNNNPTEVGLNTTAPWTMEDLEGAGARREVLLGLLAKADKAGLDDFGDGIRDLSLGKDAATPLKMLEDRTGKLHDLLTLTNEETKWGEVGAIWRELPAIFRRPDSAVLNAAHQTFLSWLNGNNMGLTEGRLGQFREMMSKHAKALATAHENAPAATDIDRIVGQMDAVVHAEPGKDGETKYHVEIPVPAVVCDAYRVLASNALSHLLELKINETRALREFLDKFESAYARQIRTQGNLTFSDYVTLLLRADLTEKANINYRLDCKVRHWLFDEFQDTSTRQWKVLSENLQEAIQDDSGERSVFFVGDLKQSLYGWRAGNPRLLEGIRAELVRLYGADAERPLPKTRRCAQPVLDLVNHLLADVTPAGPFFSPQAAERWKRVFTPHETAKKDRPTEGEAIWVRMSQPEGDAEEAVGQAEWIAKHLVDSKLVAESTGLLIHGVTCAVLVNKNEQAAKIAEVLRKKGIQAADEGETPIAEDNPLTAGFVALVRSVAHPSDTVARGIVEMSRPPREALERLGGWEAARSRLASIFQQEGAEGLIQEITRGSDPAVADNAGRFLSKRLSQLRALAASYDESGERNLDGFCRHLAGTSLRDQADPRSVQVLTVHRSKGLQYTCVYLPFQVKYARKMASTRIDMPIVHSDSGFDPTWILARPTGSFVMADGASGPLSTEVEREQGDNAYESLCRLYVGMTRAERRLVLITTELGETAQKGRGTEARHGSYDLTEFIDNMLGPIAGDTSEPKIEKKKRGKEAGERKKSAPPRIMLLIGSDSWISRTETKPPTDRKTLIVPFFAPVQRPEREKPSGHRPDDRGRPWAPAKQAASGKAFGLLVHDLMESLDWDIEAFEAELRTKTESSPDPSLTQARNQIMGFLAAPEVRAALAWRPEGALLWKEREASLMHEGKLIPAVFDRVHLVPGKEAVIYDYKTNDGLTADELREEYRKQMNTYKEVVSKLANIPKDKIRAVLVHVREGTLVEV